MKNFVAASLHFVARCKGYTVATCNERAFPARFACENACCSTATNDLKKQPFVAVQINFVAVRRRLCCTPLFRHFAPETEKPESSVQRK